MGESPSQKVNDNSLKEALFWAVRPPLPGLTRRYIVANVALFPKRPNFREAAKPPPLDFGFLWWAKAHHKKMKPCFGGEAAFTRSHKAMYRYKPGLIFKKAKFEGRRRSRLLNFSWKVRGFAVVSWLAKGPKVTNLTCLWAGVGVRLREKEVSSVL